MIDVAFWNYLEERVTKGSLTRAQADLLVTDTPACVDLLIEFAEHDRIFVGEIIHQCLLAFMHHKDVLHKKNPAPAAKEADASSN